MEIWHSFDMGKLESVAKQKRRKDYVQRAVLAAIGVAGLLSVAAVAPNTIQLLGKFERTRRFVYQTNSVLSRLAAKGHIRFETKNGKKVVTITPAGLRALEIQTETSAIRARRPKRWDNRWRMVMFDIPETRKRDRDNLRRTMIEAGFVCFQDSVWVFPYDCEDLVTLLKIDRRLGNAVRYAIVEKLENDTELRNHFELQ